MGVLALAARPEDLPALVQESLRRGIPCLALLAEHAAHLRLAVPFGVFHRLEDLRRRLGEDESCQRAARRPEAGVEKGVPALLENLLLEQGEAPDEIHGPDGTVLSLSL